MSNRRSTSLAGKPEKTNAYQHTTSIQGKWFHSNPHMDLEIVPFPRETNGNSSFPKGLIPVRREVPLLTTVKLPQSGATMLKAPGHSWSTHIIANLQWSQEGKIYVKYIKGKAMYTQRLILYSARNSYWNPIKAWTKTQIQKGSPCTACQVPNHDHMILLKLQPSETPRIPLPFPRTVQTSPSAYVDQHCRWIAKGSPELNWKGIAKESL